VRAKNLNPHSRVQRSKTNR